MLLVIGRRKPVPPQHPPKPYTVPFTVGQLPGEESGQIQLRCWDEHLLRRQKEFGLDEQAEGLDNQPH